MKQLPKAARITDVNIPKTPDEKIRHKIPRKENSESKTLCSSL